MAAPGKPSPLLLAHLEELRTLARLGPVVDVACGRGRHALHLAALGIPVIGIDRNEAHLAELWAEARRNAQPVALLRADLETEFGLPLVAGRCAAILVFRFLHRPLARALIDALQPGGLLLYETFTIHQKDLGYHIKNPDFLLQDGELPKLFAELDIREAWEGLTDDDPPTAVANIAAWKR
ncbi:MAG: class I SAM-dependent methyltransferase [Myxococcales bacterium]|nr:class I SAM-dependent methyltransferase [Myxococcales bacterium]MDH5566868.1 class I SAM-dependent methyltransferase [Myxococcales bacterium]